MWVLQVGLGQPITPFEIHALIRVDQPLHVQYIANIIFFAAFLKVSKGAKIKNRYNQVPHLTQDTNGKVTNSQIDSTNEFQEVSPFPAVTTRHK